jgi:hypothetical protein
MAKEKNIGYRLNPRHWRLSAHTVGSTTLTHEPQELSQAQAKKVLGSVYRGLPLAVEVDIDAKDPRAAADAAAEKAEAEVETEAPADNAGEDAGGQ